ncbi:hypothetical protein HPP92_025093 [Vanilla planifolia]|uniref:Uncharacterized protein n=1 Tax=Vanilla planifolia TaxID=51239 RepID=A0A835U8P2_VANPL|nr:hypothetical protein HPP92_025365 [Vanilla planifolia]KAG0453789.1 hypothetical protein HPP92_025093 [Vanilla planifolia]
MLETIVFFPSACNLGFTIAKSSHRSVSCLSPRRAAASPNGNSVGGSDGAEGKSNDDASNAAANSRAAPFRLEIRYRRRSSRRKAKEEQVLSAARAPMKKKWEEMTAVERALEFYMGEKGVLFWLNKFAYAAIFVIVGGWILFRFVGPSLGLYQLDSPLLSPTAIFNDK